jgi:predicted permease
VVIGVAGAGFMGSQYLQHTDAWVPYQALEQVMRWDNVVDERQWRGIGPQVFGRLAPGASLQSAQTQLQTITSQLAAEYPAQNAILQNSAVFVARGIGVPSDAREGVVATLRLLFGIAAVLALIAAANVMNLVVFQGIRRRAEMAVRRALGASGVRIGRQRTMDITVLALLSVPISVLLSTWLVTVFQGLAISGLPEIGRIKLDVKVLGFGLITGLVMGLLVGLLAPLAERGVSLAVALKGASARGAARFGRIRQALAAFQLAASLSLLVGALLLVGTLRNLQSVDLGFDAEKVTAFTIMGRAGYTSDQYRDLITRLTERLNHVTGIERASYNDLGPFAGLNLGHRIRRPVDPLPSVPVTITAISPDYFATLGVPLVRGRSFTESEMFRDPGAGENPVVVSESLGRALFGDSDPLGRWFGMTAFTEDMRLVERQFTVIGVAHDARWQDIVGDDAVGPLAYFPFKDRAGTAYATLLVRSELPIAQLHRLVQDAIDDLASGVPVSDVVLLRDRVQRTLAEQRLLARTVTLLTGLAVILAALGLYGLVAFSVAERRQEFGVRMALGAGTTSISNLVVQQGSRIMVFGLTLGLVGAVVLTRTIANRLFGVVPLEPVVYLLASTLMVLVVLAACLIPARAATKVDPMVALRTE